jgi:hypothetical protein
MFGSERKRVINQVSLKKETNCLCALQHEFGRLSGGWQGTACLREADPAQYEKNMTFEVARSVFSDLQLTTEAIR